MNINETANNIAFLILHGGIKDEWDKRLPHRPDWQEAVERIKGALNAGIADEIEHLERELKEARASVLSLETESHANHMRANEVEAQSAAMREALEIVQYALAWASGASDFQTGGCAEDGWTSIGRPALTKADKALSADAGRKVLDVVEAAKRVNDLCVQAAKKVADQRYGYKMHMTDSERALDEALAALK